MEANTGKFDEWIGQSRNAKKPDWIVYNFEDSSQNEFALVLDNIHLHGYYPVKNTVRLKVYHLQE
jgi:hypothetical protein